MNKGEIDKMLGEIQRRQIKAVRGFFNHGDGYRKCQLMKMLFLDSCFVYHCFVIWRNEIVHCLLQVQQNRMKSR